MAGLHKALGVKGAVVDGSVRDLAGIKVVGLPIWGTGRVPGHGVFNLVRFNCPVNVGRLRINPGELVVADSDGCTKIPEGHDPEDILRHAREIRSLESGIHAILNGPGFTLQKFRDWRAANLR